MTTKLPNGHKMYQHFPFLGPQKLNPNWDLWFENIPSSNPGENIDHRLSPGLLDGIISPLFSDYCHFLQKWRFS
jgi:hypothetical protein